MIESPTDVEGCCQCFENESGREASSVEKIFSDGNGDDDVASQPPWMDEDENKLERLKSATTQLVARRVLGLRSNRSVTQHWSL
jgi:hypothetical protein